MSLRDKLKIILKPIRFYNHEDGKLYYGEYKGSFDLLRIISWLTLHPGRLNNLLKFGQLFKFNSLRKLKFQQRIQHNLNISQNSLYTVSDLKNKFEYFCKNGAVILDNYFKDDVIDAFLFKYNHITEEFNKKNSSSSLKDIKTDFNLSEVAYLPLSEELNDLWLDSSILTFIKSAYGQKIGDHIYARNYPTALFTVISNDLIGSRFRHQNKIAGLSDQHKGPYYWHPDHSVLLNVHILLDDLDEDDPHMEFIPTKKNFLTMKHCYSDEIIEKNNLKPIKCIGKKGTVYIHAGSTIHRLKLKKGSRRVLHFEFTAGSNILYDSTNLIKCLGNGFNLDEISQEKREVLKGIFPLKYFKGYEIIGNVTQPTKFKGI